MIDIQAVRLFSLWGLSALGWAMVIALTVAWLAGERSIRVTHLRLAGFAVLPLAIFAFLLAISTKDAPLISRTELLPINTMLEFWAMTLGWTWFALVLRNTFCIRHRGMIGC